MLVCSIAIAQTYLGLPGACALEVSSCGDPSLLCHVEEANIESAPDPSTGLSSTGLYSVASWAKACYIEYEKLVDDNNSTTVASDPVAQAYNQISVASGSASDGSPFVVTVFNLSNQPQNGALYVVGTNQPVNLLVLTPLNVVMAANEVGPLDKEWLTSNSVFPIILNSIDQNSAGLDRKVINVNAGQGVVVPLYDLQQSVGFTSIQHEGQTTVYGVDVQLIGPRPVPVLSTDPNAFYAVALYGDGEQKIASPGQQNLLAVDIMRRH